MKKIIRNRLVLVDEIKEIVRNDSVGKMFVFDCDECGCEFIADAEECYITQVRYYPYYPKIDKIACICPSCGEECILSNSGEIPADMKDKLKNMCVVEEED